MSQGEGIPRGAHPLRGERERKGEGLCEGRGPGTGAAYEMLIN